MDFIRNFLNKNPWLGWALFAVLLAFSAFVFFKGGRGSDPYSPERMTEEVTIRFTDTNDEVKMTRGKMDKELRRRGDKVDPSQGIVNPKTGQPTGFLFDKEDWEEMVARINKERDEVQAGAAKTVKTLPRSERPAASPATAPK